MIGNYLVRGNNEHNSSSKCFIPFVYCSFSTRRFATPEVHGNDVSQNCLGHGNDYLHTGSRSLFCQPSAARRCRYQRAGNQRFACQFAPQAWVVAGEGAADPPEREGPAGPGWPRSPAFVAADLRKAAATESLGRSPREARALCSTSPYLLGEPKQNLGDNRGAIVPQQAQSSLLYY